MKLDLTPNATTSLGRFTGTDQTVALMLKHALGPEGEQNMKVRQWAESIIRNIAPKDYLSEILAIRHWATSPWVRYTNDAAHVEQIKSPYRALYEIEKTGVTLLDCDDIACLIAALGMSVGREASFVVVAFDAPLVLRPGFTPTYTHVFCRMKEPRSQQWIVCDPVAGPNEGQMLSRVKAHKITEVQPYG